VPIEILLTGFASVSAYGPMRGLPILEGSAAPRLIDRWPTGGPRRAFLVPRFRPADVVPGLKTRRMDRLSAWALLASTLALQDAGLDAATVDREPETISLEKLFTDVERELTACTVMWDVEQLVARVDRPWRPSEVRQRLKQLLRHVWTDRWIKAKSYRRRPHPVVPRLGVHTSVHRILMQAKEKRAAKKPP